MIKELQFIEDTRGDKAALHFLRTKEGKEIDFLISINQNPTHLIEVKWSDKTPSPAFKYFHSFLPDVKQIQLVKELMRESTYPGGISVRKALPWLARISLEDKT